MSLLSLKIVENNTESVPVVAPEFRSTPFPVITGHKAADKPAVTDNHDLPKAEDKAEGQPVVVSSKHVTFSDSNRADLPDKQEIHKENEKFLKSISDAEKLQMLRELQALDPKLYDRMRSRSKANREQQAADSPKALQSEACESLPIPDFITEQLRDGRLCNLPEPTEEDRRKMQWMLDVESETSSAAMEPVQPAEPGDLRFDFDGCLVEPERAVDVTEGLHHHGDSPHAAGYTVPELARLCRSAYPGQRVLALQVLVPVALLFGSLVC